MKKVLILLLVIVLAIAGFFIYKKVKKVDVKNQISTNSEIILKEE